MELFWIGLLVILLLLYCFIVNERKKAAAAAAELERQRKRLAELKDRYWQLLQGNDKRTALDAGRIYYSARRPDGALTVYDEQAIANDLSTMR